MLENFFILYNNECAFRQNYSGDVLQVDQAMGLCSTMRMMLEQTKPGEEEKEKNQMHVYSLHGKKYGYFQTSTLAILAQGIADEPDSMLSTRIESVKDILEYYLGNLIGTDTITKHSMVALEYAIDGFLFGLTEGLLGLVKGLNWEYLGPSTRGQLERLLSELLDKDDSIIGSALFLGGTMLHSCLNFEKARMIALQLAWRPLGMAKMRFYPVWDSKTKVWENVLLLAIGTMALALQCDISASIDDITNLLLKIEDNFAELTLALPVEPTPCLLRHFCGHDIVSMLFLHHETGLAISPAPRGGPANEQNRTFATFQWFHSRAQHQMNNSRSNTGCVTLQLNGYVFYALHKQDYWLSILLTDHVKATSLSAIVQEILANVCKVHKDILPSLPDSEEEAN